MEPKADTTFEQSIERLARRFEYPATPDVVVATRPPTDDGRRPPENSGGRRSAVGGRLAWALLLIALLGAATLAVPQTRAAVRTLFARIGAIDVFIDETAPTPTTAPTGASATAIPGPVEHSLALFELGEPVTLDEARRRVEFEIALPGSLGEPDEVYIHRNVDLPAVTLVWRNEGSAPLSLTQIVAEAFAMKMVAEESVRWIQLDGRDAVWLEGPHRLQLFGETERNSLLIESNVLIWSTVGVTYRLEGELGQAEMVAIAESVVD